MITREDLQNFLNELPNKANREDSLRDYLEEMGCSQEEIKKILTDLNSYA